MTPVAAALPDVGSLLEPMSMSPGTWYVAIYLANNFSPSLLVKTTRSSLLSANKDTIHIHCPILGINQLSSPIIHHDLVHRNLDRFSLCLPRDITLVHYTDDIMMIKLDLVRKKKQLLKTYCKTFACQRGRNKSNKNLGAFYISGISKD